VLQQIGQAPRAFARLEDGAVETAIDESLTRELGDELVAARRRLARALEARRAQPSLMVAECIQGRGCIDARVE